MTSKKVLGIIPARKGSKRIVNKNIRQLGNKSLIEWTIESAANSEISDILVSTDDLYIAEIASNCGYPTPWLRPKILSTDEASSLDVIKHSVSWYIDCFGSVDAVVMLQPTSPFRKKNSINEALAYYFNQASPHRSPVISVSPVDVNPEWCFRLIDNKPIPTIGWSSFQLRSQDLPKYYKLNGSIYVLNPVDVIQGLQIVHHGFIPYIMESFPESVDIDTESDWKIAEMLINQIGAK